MTPLVRLTAAVSLLELEVAFVRERGAWEQWNLLATAGEIATMWQVLRHTRWPRELQGKVTEVEQALKHLDTVLQQRDKTNMGAAHTHFEEKLKALRDRLYG
jgi:hypothetical protein